MIRTYPGAADARAQALALIAALAPEGHSLSFMAGALRRALIPRLVAA